MDLDQIKALQAELEAAGDDPTKVLKVSMTMTLAKDRAAIEQELADEADAPGIIEAWRAIEAQDIDLLPGWEDPSDAPFRYFSSTALVGPVSPSVLGSIPAYSNPPHEGAWPTHLVVGQHIFWDVVGSPDFQRYTHLPKDSLVRGRIFDMPLLVVPEIGMQNGYLRWEGPEGVAWGWICVTR